MAGIGRDSVPVHHARAVGLPQDAQQLLLDRGKARDRLGVEQDRGLVVLQPERPVGWIWLSCILSYRLVDGVVEGAT